MLWKVKLKQLVQELKDCQTSLVSTPFTFITDMTFSNFLSRIKVDRLNPHEHVPILFDLHEVLQERYYIHTRSRVHKVGMTIAKKHGHDKLLLHLNPEKVTKIMYFPNITPSYLLVFYEDRAL